MKKQLFTLALVALAFAACKSDTEIFEEKFAKKIKELYEHEAGPYAIYQPESTVFMDVDSSMSNTWRFKAMHTCSFRKEGTDVSYGQKTETFTGKYYPDKKLFVFSGIKPL